MAWCARAEKCSQDARAKLRTWGISDADADKVLRQLQDQHFIDDSRFALAFARDKSRFNSWGKTKISYHLQMKGIPRDLINQALAGIVGDDYQEQLERLLRNKIKTLIPIEDPYQTRMKLLRFASGRGYEPDLIFAAVDQLLKELED